MKPRGKPPGDIAKNHCHARPGRPAYEYDVRPKRLCEPENGLYASTDKNPTRHFAAIRQAVRCRWSQTNRITPRQGVIRLSAALPLHCRACGTHILLRRCDAYWFSVKI